MITHDVVELTDEQYDICQTVEYNNSAMGEELINSITKEQVIALAKSHGLSFSEWVEFDVHDYKPEMVLSNLGTVIEKGNYYNNESHKADGVTHWQPLPEPPK